MDAIHHSFIAHIATRQGGDPLIAKSLSRGETHAPFQGHIKRSCCKILPQTLHAGTEGQLAVCKVLTGKVADRLLHCHIEPDSIEHSALLAVQLCTEQCQSAAKSACVRQRYQTL